MRSAAGMCNWADASFCGDCKSLVPLKCSTHAEGIRLCFGSFADRRTQELHWHCSGLVSLKFRRFFQCKMVLVASALFLPHPSAFLWHALNTPMGSLTALGTLKPAATWVQ